ncbi:MAG: phosphonoacetaldehyde hydrolase [Candidatus Anammoximicrobium sp.]|nr:phosphonoacetaldehyde hydrolase [Candidatus Anammoximicrobium sp.]
MNIPHRFRRSYCGPVRAVVFDWAGTTVDYGCRAPTEVFRRVFAQAGVDITMDEARGPMGTYKKDHLRALLQMPAVATRWQAAYGRLPDERDVETLYAQFEPLQIACVTQYADLIPGTLQTVAAIRGRGIRIGSSTGYTAAMMEPLVAAAREQGYDPDAIVTMSHVPAGRPAPWMCFENARRLDVYPMQAVITVDDTPVGIEAGLNAGTWTAAVVRTGNEVGLSLEEVAAVNADELQRRLDRAATRLAHAGAHYVLDSIAELPACVDDVERRLRGGELP